MKNSNFHRTGVTLIELVITIGLVVIIFGGISLSYSSILNSITNTELRGAAASVLTQQIEIIRNLPYDQVGVVGGIPSGVVPSEQSVAWGQASFVIKTVIRNVDDPFDGTLTGNPGDTAPSDYKLVEVEATCPACSHFFPLSITANVAPKNLESASNNGSLFVNVFDASGQSISGATVNLVNASVTPSINLTDATNNLGVLQLVGVPTSTQGYRVYVSLSGYTTDRTYQIGDPANPNPSKPDATVAVGTLTQISFAIDKASKINVYSQDVICSPYANKNFSISGTKLIGTNPDVLKYSTSSATGSNGLKTLDNIEWDTYSLSLNEPSYDVVGTMPFSPLTINPSSTLDFNFILQPSQPPSLLVTVKDAVSGAVIPNASVNLSKSGFSGTLITGRNFLKHTDWSNNQYSSQDGGIAVGSPVGTLQLVGSPYPTSTTSWLTSNTFDVGSSSSMFYTLNWLPTSQPGSTGADSAKFQIASNNDQVTWNFLGSDGTAGTYYALSGMTINNQHNGNRYIRYKVFLSTQNENITPQIDDVNIEFRSICVPPSQVLFTNLGSGTYTLDATASQYYNATGTVSVSGNWQQAELLMTHQ